MSSSYSSLIRRSKLSTFNPAIEQVYSSHTGHLARSSFGLKRPLPSSEVKISPFIRLHSLDNGQKRTSFRKATKEYLLLKKWGEVGVGIRRGDGKKWGTKGQEVVRSVGVGGKRSSEAPLAEDRFYDWKGYVEGPTASSSRTVDVTTIAESLTTPNIFALSESDFEKFLDSLAGRREEFIEFLKVELTKDRSTEKSEMLKPTDLYENAQLSPSILDRKIAQFLSSSNTTPSSSSIPPSPHPLLSLQYSPPTQLESVRSPSLPGRILGPIRSSRANSLVSLLSQITVIDSNNSSGASSTTFFPDSEGIRSNIPGQARFIIQPTMNAEAFTRSSTMNSRRGAVEMWSNMSRGNGHEAEVLASKTLSLGARATDGVDVDPVGSMAYSGRIPPMVKRNQYELLTMSGMGGPGYGLSAPADLMKGGGRKSGREATASKVAGDRLAEERMTTDRNSYGQGAKKKGAMKKKKGSSSMLDALKGLLDEA